MTVFFLTAGLFSLFLLAMAIGVIVKDRPLKGSCGGPKIGADGQSHCCQDSSVQCDKTVQEGPATD